MNDDYLSDFLLYLELDLNYSNNTIKSYDNDIEKLIKFYPQKDILKLSVKDIEKYITDLHELSASSVSRNISSLRTFYNYFLKLDKIAYNPCDSIKQPKLGNHLPTYLTLEETEKLLDIKIETPFDARNKAILEIMYATGLRISETISLEFKNIDLEECIVRVMGKGSKERIVPINDYAIESLEDYLNNYRPLLVKNSDTNYLFLNIMGEH